MRFGFIVVLLALVSPAVAKPLHEPRLTIAKGGPEHPQVALTFDACSGGIDRRILDTLIDNRIPATLFVTRRWLARNGPTVRVLADHPELFEIEDHGAEHVPAVLGSKAVYGIKPAGTLAAVEAEVEGGAGAIATDLGVRAGWFRGATALYSPDALALIKSLGFRIAGYSVSGDEGATASATKAARTIGHARDGDVIIAHINQPNRMSGEGVAKGILELKARGFSFRLLKEVETAEDDNS
ncbi:polysaccharide deacetylase family protein [Shinella sp.]|uniref:polysaccharide deacetylase family protein n=1 Tax=Shinella sp. TaxID=1870904 RepID=UPI0028A82B72|nr:polysaccharide deacetylase family protein [Shinella sp.]